jgi:hypothetical protein
MRAVLIIALVCALPTSPASGRERGWREAATPDDRRRLRGWRNAWMAALPAARAGGGASTIAADPALFDPDRALRDPVPPPGLYGCRTIKLGSQGGRGPAFVVYDRFRCRVWENGRFSKLDGSQRPVGAIHPDTTGRAVFLGTLMLGEERKPIKYGRDRERDMVGVVERIGPARWRMVFPYPRFESLVDVIELVPDSVGAAGSVGATGGGTTASLGATGAAGRGGSAAR